MIVRERAFAGDGPELHAALSRLPHAFALDDSGPERAAPLTLVGFAPRATLTWRGRSGRIASAAGQVSETTDLAAALRRLATFTPPLATPAALRDVPFVGGLLGFLGYDARLAFDVLPDRAPREGGLPDAWFGAYPAVAVLDEGPGRLRLIAGGDDPADAALLDAAESALDAAASGAGAATPGPATAARATRRPAVSAIAKAAYLERVEAVREAIRAGDVYQINLTQRFLVPFDDDPRALWRRLRQAHPAPYGAFFRCGEATVVSASPECFLKVDGDRVLTRPIKGTAPRGGDPAEDRTRAAALAASGKDRAELAMIVDLMRNDLSRVCRPGTVEVPRFAAPVAAPTVHHLVGEVTGRLRPDADVFDLVRAAFPAGSITGAPKLRAMELIDRLEATRRGVYTGSIGHVGRDGRAELSVAIRTLTVEDGWARVHGGGGVVIDSSPAAEYDESTVKVRGLLDALDAEIRT